LSNDQRTAIAMVAAKTMLQRIALMLHHLPAEPVGVGLAGEEPEALLELAAVLLFPILHDSPD